MCDVHFLVVVILFLLAVLGDGCSCYVVWFGVNKLVAFFCFWLGSGYRVCMSVVGSVFFFVCMCVCVCVCVCAGAYTRVRVPARGRV